MNTAMARALLASPLLRPALIRLRISSEAVTVPRLMEKDSSFSALVYSLRRAVRGGGLPASR